MCCIWAVKNTLKADQCLSKSVFKETWQYNLLKGQQWLITFNTQYFATVHKIVPQRVCVCVRKISFYIHEIIECVKLPLSPWQHHLHRPHARSWRGKVWRTCSLVEMGIHGCHCCCSDPTEYWVVTGWLWSADLEEPCQVGSWVYAYPPEGGRRNASQNWPSAASGRLKENFIVNKYT